MHFFALHLQTMAKVITSILKFPPDQAQKVLEKEDSKVTVSMCGAAEGVSVDASLFMARDCPLMSALLIILTLFLPLSTALVTNI